MRRLLFSLVILVSIHYPTEPAMAQTADGQDKSSPVRELFEIDVTYTINLEDTVLSTIGDLCEKLENEEGSRFTHGRGYFLARYHIGQSDTAYVMDVEPMLRNLQANLYTDPLPFLFFYVCGRPVILMHRHPPPFLGISYNETGKEDFQRLMYMHLFPAVKRYLGKTNVRKEDEKEILWFPTYNPALNKRVRIVRFKDGGIEVFDHPRTE